jgi:hypothetical protein
LPNRLSRAFAVYAAKKRNKLPASPGKNFLHPAEFAGAILAAENSPRRNFPPRQKIDA